MFIAAAKMKIYIEWSFSLKDKRQVRYSLKDRLRKDWNVSVSEVEKQDSHKELVLGISSVQISETSAENFLQNIEEFVSQNTDAELQEFEYDIIKF